MIYLVRLWYICLFSECSFVHSIRIHRYGSVNTASAMFEIPVVIDYNDHILKW